MLKKLSFGAVGLLLLMTPVFASADVISDMQTQIQQLLTQIAALKSQTGSTQSTSSAAVCVSLTYSLSVEDTDADSNGEVTKLQQFLANQGISIYPEARVTGFFGPATMRAVQRWQKMKGIVSSGDPDSTGYGFVGSRTRTAMACGAGQASANNSYVAPSAYVPPTNMSNGSQPSPSSGSMPPVISMFTASTNSVQTGQPVTFSWSSNAANCHIMRNESNGGYTTVMPNVGSASSHTVYPAASGTYTLNCFYQAEPNGKDGANTSKSLNITVSSAPTPTVTLQASPSTVTVGQSSTISWSSTNANRCGLQYGSNEQNGLSMSGSQVVTPSQTTSYRLWCTNDPGNGKDGPTADKTVLVSVQNPTHVFNGNGVSISPVPNAAAYMAAVNAMPNTSFSLSGTASVAGPLTVVLVEVKYAGSTDWTAVSNLTKDGSGYRAVSNTSQVSGGNWSASYSGLPEGYYHIFIYDASYNLKGSGYFVATAKG